MAVSRPATAPTAEGSRPATAKSSIDDEEMEDDNIGGDEDVAPEDEEIADV